MSVWKEVIENGSLKRSDRKEVFENERLKRSVWKWLFKKKCLKEVIETSVRKSVTKRSGALNKISKKSEKIWGLSKNVLCL